MTDATCSVDGVCEVTLGPTDRPALEAIYTSAVEFSGPVEHPVGDRSLDCEDPAGNVLELWDFFQRGDGVRGVDALASSGG